MSDTNGHGRDGQDQDGQDQDGANGAAPAPPGIRAGLPAAPTEIAELASGCVRFVQQALGVRLDFTPETLPVLDHYLRERRAELREHPEAAALVLHAAAAYFGEVVRRQHAVWWSVPTDDPNDWEIQARAVFLSFHPLALVQDAVLHAEGEDAIGLFEVEDDDRDRLAARLAELPPVDEDEYFSLSTRLEVIDIAVDAIKARMMESGLGDVEFGPSDYDG